MSKEFSAKVPDEQYEDFVKNTDGIYGASTWFINTALREFNERLSQQPNLRQLIKESVATFLKERREVSKT